MEDFVPFEIANKLKKKGFNEKTFGFYSFPLKLPQYPITYVIKNYNKKDNFYSAPTICQVLKWLREEKKIHLYTDIDNEGWFFEIKCLKTRVMINTNFFKRHRTCELAAIAGIEYVIDNLI